MEKMVRTLGTVTTQTRQTATEATAPAAATPPSQILMGTLKSTVSLNLPLSDFQALLFLGALFLTGVGEQL